jgi:excisionase family DNA binding protein
VSDSTYLTLAEASERYQLSIRTLRRRISDGSIRAYRCGPRAIRLRAAELDDLARPIPTAGQ